MKICLVGCGAMGSALLKGWLQAQQKLTTVTVITPHRETVEPFLTDPRVLWAPDPRALSFQPDAFIFAVKPQVLPSLVPVYKNCIKSSLILSIAAGLDLAFFERHFPGHAIVRAMPNTPAQVFEGVTGLVGNSLVSEAQRALALSLMESVGPAHWIEKDEWMDLVTALSGCGPAYFFTLTDVLARVARELGLPANLAEQLARQTFIGSAAYLKNSGRDPATLAHEVTSKGGMTEAALDVLRAEDGLEALFGRALRAALLRGKELRGGQG